MAVIFVPRTFGGTLILTINTTPLVPSGAAIAVARGRDGLVVAHGRDSIAIARGRDGKAIARGR